jgi:hypothetical protein
VSVSLERLVLTFKPGEASIEIRALYGTKDGPGPGTKARAQDVRELTAAGLEQALDALEGRVDVVGTSGYETREDTLMLSARRGA